jgi:hypothetical protein
VIEAGATGPTGQPDRAGRAEQAEQAGPARDRRLWAELLRRTRRDQELRRRLAADAGPTPDRVLLAELAAVDDENSAWLAGVVTQRGWPGRTLVGDDGVMAAWMLAQHADTFPDRQRAFLTALARAVAVGEASPAQHAYLQDRVRVNAGRPQLFGTQSTITADGVREPFPIEDPDGLPARRAAAGLPPLF